MRAIRTVGLIIVLVLMFSVVSFGHVEYFDFDSMDLFMNHGAVMMIIDPESGCINYANVAAAEFYHHSIQELQTMTIDEINSLSPEETKVEMELATSEARNYFLFKHELGDGRIRDVEVYSYPIEIGGDMLLYSIVVDVTDKLRVEALAREHDEHERENMQTIIYGLIGFFIILAVFLILLVSKNRKLAYLSKYDALTGVFNRDSIRILFEKYMQKNKFPLGFFMIDVNNLKFINDTFGHIVGDKMIIEVSDKLLSVNGGNNHVARVSGDEFVLLIQPCDREIIKLVQKEICEFEVEIEGIHFDVSVGHMLIEESHVSYHQGFTTSESKMYTAKAHSKEARSHAIEEQMLQKIYLKNKQMRNQAVEGPKVVTFIAEALELPREEVRFVTEAYRLQGIGHAIDIDDYLASNAISTDEEMNMFRRHPEKGYNILNALGKSQNISNGVFYHHENYNGTGFPKGLVGEEIPLTSRIISLVNGIIKEMKLQKDLPIERVWQVVKKQSGIIYDPKLIERLDDIMLLKEIETMIKSFPN